MDAEDAKDLERYIRDKRRAEAKSDLREVSQLCNCIGGIYSKYGMYEDAIEEHKQERLLSETLGDRIGEAVAYRKIGECLCAQELYKEALELQKKHLIIARECGNHIEEQRAWATIGRTYLSQAESRNLQESSVSNRKAEKAFVKALEACDKVKSSVPPSEYMSMKGRIYLNLGLVYDLRGGLQEGALNMMKRALAIAEKFKLDEERYLCHASLAVLSQKGNQFSQALRSLDMALAVAEKLRNRVWQRETFVQKATTHVSMSDFLSAKHNLKKAHKLKVGSDVSEKKLRKMFHCVSKMQEANQDIQNENNPKEAARLYEIMADSAAELGNFSQAIENYLKVLQYASVMSSDKRADIYMSLAQSYADIRQYDSAVFYYNKDLEERKDNPEQACWTFLNIAELEELKGSSYPTICKIYMSAFGAARRAKNIKLQIQTLKSLIVLQQTWQQTIHLEETQRKLSSLLQKKSLSENSESDEDKNVGEAEEAVNSEEDANLSLSDLTMSEESDDDCGPVRVDNRKKPIRRNEKGETILHRACISGNLKKVKSLIAEGHPVNTRDYCGWLPLHEACNHGHVDIVKCLLDAGAWINDRGGERCGGVSPLIDAASCGHLDVVRLLVERGAQVLAKDDDGNTALDNLRSWHSKRGDIIEAGEEMEYKNIEKLMQEAVDGDPCKTGEAGASKEQPPVKLTLQVGSTTTESAAVRAVKDVSPSQLACDSTLQISNACHQQKNVRREKLTKLKQKRDCKLSNEYSQKLSEINESLTSSDDEPTESGRGFYLRPPNTDLEKPSSEVYREAINSVASSAHKRLEVLQQSQVCEETEFNDARSRPALVNADEDVGDDWLVNDVHWPQNRRKSDAVNNILTTSSSRKVAGKRSASRKEKSSEKFTSPLRKKGKLTEAKKSSGKFTSPLRKKGKLTEAKKSSGKFTSPLRKKGKLTEAKKSSGKFTSPLRKKGKLTGSKNCVESSVVRTDFERRNESLCPVSSSTETDKWSMLSNKWTTEAAWDSDDEMLCQIDIVHDVDKDFAGYSENGNSASRITSPGVKMTRKGHIPGCYDPRAGNVQREILSQRDSVNSSHRHMQNQFAQRPVISSSAGAQGGDTNPTFESKTFEKPTYKNSIRVKVKVGDQTLLIPIQPADQEKNVSWLFQQVRERYFSMFLILPTLTLSTQDGTILCPSDTISTILLDNDILTANVIAWERPKLEDRYTQSCKLCLSSPNAHIITLLQKADQSGHVLLADMGLGLSLLQPVFQALEDHRILTELKLDGNRLGDSGLGSLMKLLATLPVLKTLSLEANGISAEGIQIMASSLKSEPCLYLLSALSLSHNCLDDIAAEPLSGLITYLPKLSQLSVSSCNFSYKLFTSSLCEALQERRLEHMDIAENQIGDEGIKCLLQVLHPDCLRELNISHTCLPSSQDIHPYLEKFASDEECCLQELLLAGNHLSQADVTFINRLPVLAKSLRCLVLSQNQNVNSRSLQKLLYLSSEGGSQIDELTIRGCSITSPLDPELLEALKSKMACSVPLKKFVFTCRGFRTGESQVLENIWLSRWKEHGQVKADGMTVSMTIV